MILSRFLDIVMRQRAAVLLGALVVAAIGVWAAMRLPIDAVPDITNPQVQINTAVPALAPEEVEKLVTFPIESEMAGLPGHGGAAVTLQVRPFAGHDDVP